MGTGSLPGLSADPAQSLTVTIPHVKTAAAPTPASAPVAGPKLPPQGGFSTRRRRLWLVGAVLALGLLVGLALWMTGPAPQPASDGASESPPPLVLREADAKHFY